MSHSPPTALRSIGRPNASSLRGCSRAFRSGDRSSLEVIPSTILSAG